MKCAFISDLHIKTSDDDAAKLFVAFCRSKETLDSNKVILLGDIFDFLVGDHSGYTKKYSFFFNEIVTLLNQGKEVVFIEGNHDFHFKKAFTDFVEKNSSLPEKFRYLLRGEYIVLNGEKYFYCHGYEVDYENIYFKRWYRVYSSCLFKVFTTYILNFSLVQKLGAWASSDSKKRGKKSFNYESMKQKYIQGANCLLKDKKIKGVIAGHTHIPEFHTYPDGTLYLNVGFPSRDKHFLFYNGKGFEKVPV